MNIRLRPMVRHPAEPDGANKDAEQACSADEAALGGTYVELARD